MRDVGWELLLYRFNLRPEARGRVPGCRDNEYIRREALGAGREGVEITITSEARGRRPGAWV